MEIRHSLIVLYYFHHAGHLSSPVYSILKEKVIGENAEVICFCDSVDEETMKLFVLKKLNQRKVNRIANIFR